MIFDYMATWTLHGWSLFCCTIATLGLFGAFFAALAARGGKGIFRFLEHDQQPTVILVNGGQYVAPPKPRRWTFGRYYLLFAAIFSGGPMLTLLLLAANHAAWYAIDWLSHNWWVLLVPSLAILIFCAFWWLIRRDAHSEQQDRDHLAALPAYVSAPAVAAQPAVGWTLDPSTPQWSER